MASIFESLRNLGRSVLSSASEGAARAISSFSERIERNNSLIYEQRAHLPRGQERRRLRQQHLTGERAFSQVMQGMGWGSAYPTPWTQNRAAQIQSFHRWVYIAITCIMNRIGAMPPRLAIVEQGKPQQPHGGRVQKARQARYRKSLHAIKPHEEIEEIGPDHPLSRILAKPNAWTKSPGKLWSQAAMFLLLTGRHFQWIVPDQAFGKPLEIWTIPSHWCWGPQIGPAGMKYYKIIPFLGGRGQFTMPADEIVDYSFDNPLMPIEGFSPTQAGADWIDQGMYLDRSRTNAFINGTQSQFALKMGPKYDPDENDIEAIGAKFLARYQGVNNAGQPIILPPDMEPVPLTIAPKDMAYIESFPQVRDGVLSLFRVPHEVAGITDAGSHTAYYGPLRQFDENAIFPLCRLIADVFTVEVCTRWDDHLRLWWDSHSPDAPEETNAMLNMDLQHGIRAPNEARAERGLEPYDDPLFDEPWLPQGMQPLSVIKEQMEQQKQQAQQASMQQQIQAQQPQQQPGQADAEDAAIDLNDLAWQDDEGAVQKSHVYNQRLEAAGGVWRVKRGSDYRFKAYSTVRPAVEKRGTMDVKGALHRAGKELAQHEDPAPMPGYGQIFLNDSDVGGHEAEVWYVGGDGDEDGFGKVVEEKIREAFPAVGKITYEAESFPPKDEGWVQVYPKQKPHASKGVNGVLVRKSHNGKEPYTVAVDLDGTLAEYDGWKGENHFGELRPGAVEALQSLRDRGCQIIIFTTRGNTKKIRAWLEEHHVPFDYINENPDQPSGTSGKVIADLYLDDRAIDARKDWHQILNETLNRMQSNGTVVRKSNGDGMRDLEAAAREFLMQGGGRDE